MNKLELIQALKDATDLSKSEAAVVVDIFFNGMAAMPWPREIELKSADYARFSSRNTNRTLGAILKPESGSRLLLRSCPSLRRVRS